MGIFHSKPETDERINNRFVDALIQDQDKEHKDMEGEVEKKGSHVTSFGYAGVNETDMSPFAESGKSVDFEKELRRMAHIAIKRGEYATAEYLAKALEVHTYGGV